VLGKRSRLTNLDLQVSEESRYPVELVNEGDEADLAAFVDAVERINFEVPFQELRPP
jgi:hypothetical protein